MTDILVAKIGGSTLGAHDTTLADVVALKKRGIHPVVVHGGGALVSEWLARHNVPTRFERGLRVTDAETLKVVVAVLAGLVNKELVGQISALGAGAVGICGADAGILRARVSDEKLGFVGDITGVDSRPLKMLLGDGLIPVIAPIAAEWDGDHPTGQLLNTNADTAAGAIAAALGARWLAFLTDVEGVRGGNGAPLASVSADEARSLIADGVVEGGMIPKVEACVRAVESGCTGVIADGRKAHALLDVVEGRSVGTQVVV